MGAVRRPVVAHGRVHIGDAYLDYGLTEEQWTALLIAVGWRCPACNKPFSAARRPQVDHNHLTGLVRGPLCAPCNIAVGERHDLAVWFARVAEYLNNPPAVSIIGSVYVPGSPGADDDT